MEWAMVPHCPAHQCGEGGIGSKGKDPHPHLHGEGWSDEWSQLGSLHHLDLLQCNNELWLCAMSQQAGQQAHGETGR